MLFRQAYNTQTRARQRKWGCTIEEKDEMREKGKRKLVYKYVKLVYIPPPP